MITEHVLTGKLIQLKQITLQDCTKHYVNWLNDPQVNQFLEIRYEVHDIKKIKEFVKSQCENNHSYLFKIIYRDNNAHIGNIKIGPINPHHHNADISYFIGEKTFWGKGIATEAIQLILMYAFEELNLHKVSAGTYSTAIGSFKALEKNGFKKEAIFREQVYDGKNYIDVYRYGILKNEYCNRNGDKI